MADLVNGEGIRDAGNLLATGGAIWLDERDRVLALVLAVRPGWAVCPG
ncbi:MAG TPA: hypothetical protein VGN51_19160 [Acidimicrobiia bacterium]